MSSGQGWFESDEDYGRRVEQEAAERTIENFTGSAPSKGWFESDDSYRERISQEANEHRIEESTGSAPSQGWFEGAEDYQDRIAREANERTIETSTGSAPSQGWFESNDDYDTRVRKEANESVVGDDVGSSPKQGWFEGDYEYRSRIAREAREVRARERPVLSTDNSSVSSHSYDNDYSYSPSSSSTGAGSTSSSAPKSFGTFLLLAVLGVLITAAYLIYSKPLRSLEAKPVNWAAPPRLSLKGLGPIRIGMTLGEARLAIADSLTEDPFEGGGSEGCFYVKPSGAPDGIAFMVTNGIISRIDIFSPLYSSISGARVGQAQGEVVELYPGKLEVTGHQYNEKGYYLTYIPQDAGDQSYRMVFETDGHQITNFRAGKLPEVQYVEGCL